MHKLQLSLQLQMPSFPFLKMAGGNEEREQASAIGSWGQRSSPLRAKMEKVT